MAIAKLVNKAAVLVALGLAQTVAMAQSFPPVVVTFGTDIASVPTLSQWAMIVMSILLALVAIGAIRKGANSKTILSLALAALVSFGVLGDSKWLGGAWANGYTTYYLSTGSNGQLSLPSDRPFAYVNNNTSIPQKILGISPLYDEQREEGGNPPCAVGLVLQVGSACAVRTRPPA